MTTKLGAVVLAVLLSACGGWTRADTIGEMASQMSLMADWATTEEAMAMGLDEGNPVARRMTPGVYFPVLSILHFGIAAALPPKARTLFQGLTVGVQAKTVYVNMQTMERARERREGGWYPTASK